MQLVDDETGEVIGESVLPREEIRDNFYSRFDLKAETEPGKTYTLRIMADSTVPEGEDPALSVYCYPAGAGEETSGFLNGEKQDFDWAAVIEYDPE